MTAGTEPVDVLEHVFDQVGVAPEPDLIDKRGHRWRWNTTRCAYYPDGTPSIVAVHWSKDALETVYSPLTEAEHPAMTLVADFITAAGHLTNNRHTAALETLLPHGPGDRETHLRAHLLAAAAAVTTGAIARKALGEPPEDGTVYHFRRHDLGPTMPYKHLADQLATAGANVDADTIRSLIIASCAVEHRGCRLVSMAIIELARIYADMETRTEITP